MKILKLVLFKLLAPQYIYLFCECARNYTRIVGGDLSCSEISGLKSL